MKNGIKQSICLKWMNEKMASPLSLKSACSVDLSNRNFEAFLQSVISTIRSKNNKVILLEGSSDVKVLKNFFVGTIICVPCTGKCNVTKVIKRLPQKYIEVIGIADKDYEITLSNDSRLFYYDFINLEMTIVQDNTIFDNLSVFNSHSISKVFNSSAELIQIKNTVLEWLVPVSVFRKTMFEELTEDQRISRDDAVPNLSICKTLSKSDLATRIKTFIHTRLSSKGYDSSRIGSILSKYDNYLHTPDCLNITQGHDFVELFNSETGIQSDDDFYEIIKIVYEKKMFAKTSLHSKIKQYEILQGTVFLKA